MTQIIPAILTSDLNEVKDKLKRLQGLAYWIHIDILDGKFVDNKTVSLKQLKTIPLLRKFKTILHLMVKDPIKLVKDAKSIGARVVVGQIEMMPDQDEFVKAVKKRKMKVGLALDYDSSIEKINEALLKELDVILIMTIKAGWSGQKFKKMRLEEVKKLKRLKVENGYKYKIAVDGGVNNATIKDCIKAGADYLFMHSAIWKSKDVKKRIKELHSVISKQ